ncbi:MAG: tRNA glutamyl-Q(34) synthetase GluQRS [Wenzhouxiangellaceae bacterium]
MMSDSRDFKPEMVRGRFAPSPTGPLHFGSLMAAVGSFLQARTRQGLWLVRIEDLDPPREVPGAARDQLASLRRFGMRPDRPVIYQSSRTALYHQALERLIASGRAYPCACSRRELPDDGIYPGTCRNGIPPGRRARSIRFRVQSGPEAVDDRVFGRLVYDLERDSGDFVIRRGDGLIAYQLAVVVDDADQRISEVVRGADLLDSSARQQQLYRALGWSVPRWLHLPLAVDRSGRKLSKSDDADPVVRRRPAEALRLALTALGHRPPPGARSLDAQWRWALGHWNPGQIPRDPFEL